MNRVQTIFLSLLFLFLTLPLVQFAQQITLSGIIPNGAHHLVRLRQNQDLISPRLKNIAQTVSDSSGAFFLQFDLYNTEEFELWIDLSYTSIILTPNSNYSIELKPVAFKGNTPLTPQNYSPAYTILSPKSENEINWTIASFMHEQEKIILDHYENNNFSFGASIKQELENAAQQFLETHHPDPFLELQVACYTAENTLATQQSFAPEHYLDLLLDDRNQAENRAYRSLFKSIFSNYALSRRKIDLRKLQAAVEEEKTLAPLIDLFGSDSLLVNERLRELVILQALSEFYHSSLFSKEAVKQKLTAFSLQSKWPYHREIARNLLASQSELAVGSPAPDLPFLNAEGDKNWPAEFTGKPLYINFFNPDNEDSFFTLTVLNELYYTYKDYIEIIAISITPDLNQLLEIEENFPFEFPIFAVPNIETIEAWHAELLPVNILIGSDGKVVQFPANSIKDGIVDTFETIKVETQQQQLRENRRDIRIRN